MAVEITQIDTQDLTTQLYETQDTNLISTFDINTSLSSSSYIEYFIYDLNQNLLFTEYNFTQYSVLNDGQSSGNMGVLSQIEINLEQNLTNLGYTQGEYISYYNFLNKQVGSNLEQLYISEISPDRTEIRLDSTTLSNQDITEQTNAFIQQREDSTYFLDFYLNFGDNTLFIANNIILDNQDPTNPTILIKLYEPLPEDFNLNSTLWVVSSIEEPSAYRVSFIEDPIVFLDTTSIKGPNFNLDLKDQVNNSTQELSYVDLISTTLTSSQNQLNSLLEEKEIDINIDYTNFSNFTHFSSAQTRLENFYYKVSLIEQYSSSLATLNSTVSSSTIISENSTVLESKINNIITNFDGWDYYLYYSSGSWAWPKTNTEPPYQLATTGSVDVLNWFGSTNEYSPLYGGVILSASLYDENNKDNLLFSIPEYLREDPDNQPYELFIDMVAQHFDNIWIYYKDVTQKYNADNRLESGISKDIVADAIRDFGIKLYQNSFSNEDLYTSFLGLTPNGGLFPFPNITGSLPTPSGFEYIDTLVSASNDYIPLDDVNKSLYKRIYHNLPYLLKAKGTLPGLRALITSYGIPDTILRINEYGGKDKVNSNDWDYWQDEFNFSYSTEENNFISSSWTLNSDWKSTKNVPATLAFRFKTPGLPTQNIRYSQSLWSNESGSAITLRYSGSAYTSGSYQGSIIDPQYQYATLEFYPDISIPTVSASVYLPFFDGGWWSVMVTTNKNAFKLSAANKIYEGGDNGTTLGFYSTSSISAPSIPWYNSTTSYFPVSFSVATVSGYDIVTYDNTAIYDGTGSLAGMYEPFSGSYQEIRYYTKVLNSDSFKDYVMNPYSIEGNSLNTAPNELAFRASLGGEFFTSSISIHPKVTGSWAVTQSFPSGSDFYYDLTPIFKPNTEYFFFDQPVAGIKNAVSDKIRIEDDNIPSGSTLSPFRRLAQTTEASASYSPNINLLEVAFSPQDEINDDINSSIGFFNIGNFVGDPAFRSSRLTTYPDLDRLRNEYFQKYTKNYNLVDFIRLIKFFDNSLFKMIRDFVPARTSLASGIVIKQTLLERNRYPEPQISYEDLDISGTIKPQWNDYNEGTIENFSGGTAGMFEPFNGVDTSPYGVDGNGPDNRFGITQSWNETYPTLSGSVTIIHDSQDEFYNGEFNGSTIIVTTQSLNQPYPPNFKEFTYTTVVYGNLRYNQSTSSLFTENEFLTNPYIQPDNGEIYILVPKFDKNFLPFKGDAFIKINKLDCNGNDNTLPLSQINKITIQFLNTSQTKTYDILSIVEFPTYYLYQTPETGISLSGNELDNYIKDYTISASNSNTYLVSGSQKIILTSSYNPNSYYNDSTGYYNVDQVPNIKVDFTMSWTASATGGDAELSFLLIKTGSTYTPQTLLNYPGPNLYIPNGNTVYYTWSGSLNPYTTIFGDNLINQTNNIFFAAGVNKDFYTGNINYSNFILEVNQKLSPTASICDPVILEPYILTPNFYNSDQNAIINNVEDERTSTLFQEVNYTTGILTPTNLDLILSGSAQRAAVQDSNYTTARIINPRYNGSRTTSQRLNKWSPPNTIPNYADEGTYGKLPTVDSLKTAIAYCDFIGGWPPERMNASGAHILYLIKADGTVVVPNTSENSLYDNQGTFESGERVSISSQTTSTNGETNYRKIIRGGTRIEPILYTQIGHSPASWSPVTMSFTTNFITDQIAINDYQANSSPSNLYPTIPDGTFGVLDFSNPIYVGVGATWNNNEYIITQSLIEENVSLDIKAKIKPYLQHPLYGAQVHNVTVKLIYSSSIGETILQEITQTSNLSGYNGGGVTPLQDMDFQYTLYPQNMEDGGSIFFRGAHLTSTYGPTINGARYARNSYLKVEQTPAPTDVNITSSGTNSIWGYPDNTKLYAITASNKVITDLYNKGFKQVDISGSGFNPISLPWSLKIGDEFRFEGNENNTFTVKNIYDVNDSGSARISQTGSLEIHFGSILPSSSINLDHFIVRRYVDDASLILLEGYKPTGAEGPFLVKPEFVTPELNKSIDQVIVDLTQKGLL